MKAGGKLPDALYETLRVACFSVRVRGLATAMLSPGFLTHSVGRGRRGVWGVWGVWVVRLLPHPPTPPTPLGRSLH